MIKIYFNMQCSQILCIHLMFCREIELTVVIFYTFFSNTVLGPVRQFLVLLFPSFSPFPRNFPVLGLPGTTVEIPKNGGTIHESKAGGAKISVCCHFLPDISKIIVLLQNTGLSKKYEIGIKNWGTKHTLSAGVENRCRPCPPPKLRRCSREQTVVNDCMI